MKKTFFITGAAAIIVLIGAILLFQFLNKKEVREVQSIKQTLVSSMEEALETATFAGGCFWCMEPPFEKRDGVLEVVSGYTGGTVKHPTYKAVSTGGTGHVEAVQIRFNPQKITYEQLLQIYWRQINPTDDGGQFVDRGEQYRSVIFYHDETQRLLAEKSKRELEQSGRFEEPIVTEIKEAKAFYPAEEYHQDYYLKNPLKYKYYRNGSGRDQFLEKAWGEDRHLTFAEETDSRYKNFDKQKRLQALTELQYKVTQEDGTEKPFDNAYWDNKKDGIYVDIVSGEPLFSSLDKYESGTGWPSFTKPLEPDHIVYKIDKSHFSVRVELRSKYADSHLGHVFDDGPQPLGLRYCINSAALRFIPKEKLEAEGYGEYVKLFEKAG